MIYLGNDVERIFNNLKECYIDLESTNKILREENKKLRDAHYKDETIAKLQEKNRRLISDNLRGFSISEDEETNIKNWIDSHTKIAHNNSYSCGCIGGGYSYYFLPTSIGVIGRIQCDSCLRSLKKKAYQESQSYSDYCKKLSEYKEKFNVEYCFQDL